MKNAIFALFALFLLTLSSADAAVYKGQKIFVKKCLPCHDNTQAFVSSRNAKSWKKLMLKSGEPLAALHLKSKKAKKSWKYFESSQYSKKSKHLSQFMVEYAKDSGNVPACN